MSNTVRIDERLREHLERGVTPRLDEDGRQVRCLLMYSGGLDSTLAGIILRLQGIDVVAINCFTGFCLTDHKRKMGHERSDGSRYQNEAIVGAAGLQIPVEVVDVREGYLKVLTEPKHGWGSSVNPCIDCRIHMLSYANRELMEEYEAHFIATGEVLGQRPMTQMRRQMKIIEQESNLEGLVVRPLCQQALDESIPEQRGWVDRDSLLGINGRGRKEQIRLAEQFGVLDYPQPAGGCCFLTDGSYGNRLKDTIEHRDHRDLDFDDVLVLKVGRHFRLPSGNKLIVGRNQDENLLLRSYWHLGVFMQVSNFPGPLSLYLGDEQSDDLELALRITARYADCPADKEVELHLLEQDDVKESRNATPFPRGEERAWQIL